MNKAALKLLFIYFKVTTLAHVFHRTFKAKKLYLGHTFSPPTRKRSIAARLMQSFSQSPSSRSLMDTPALSGTEQHEPSGKLMLHCLKGALPPPRSVDTDTAPRETSPWRKKTETETGRERVDKTAQRGLKQ